MLGKTPNTLVMSGDEEGVIVLVVRVAGRDTIRVIGTQSVITLCSSDAGVLS